MRLLARGAFFISGIAGLTFEIVWFRYLNLSMGATTLAVATTTAAYMGGLALGSHWGGKIADRFGRPLVAYGVLEVAIGLFGLVIPFLTRHLSVVDAALFGSWESGAARAVVRFFVAALILGVPTTAMGMTLPVLARAVTRHAKEVGREVGFLYALNIAGAMAGAGLTGFLLIPEVGLAATNSIAVGLDVLLGGAAALAGLSLPKVDAAPEPEAPVLAPTSGRLVLILAVTGASAMSLQVLWTRALGTALGPSTYAFSAIVCTYLAGLALGGAVASRLADRVVATRVALCSVLLATGLAALGGIAVVDDLPLLIHGIVLDPKLSTAGLFRSQFALAALSVLPATIGMGAIFPLTIAAVVGSHARLGAAVGRAYAINTVGAIFGSFAGVFVLLPLFGVEWGMRVSALGYVGCAMALAWGLEPHVGEKLKNGLRIACTAAVLVSLAWPSWNVGQWTLGMYRLSMTRSYFADEAPKASPVVFHEDGLAATVTVEQDMGVRWIKVDGKIDGSSEGDMPTQVLSGLLASFFRPDAKNIAVIGCGSCVTIGTALATGVDRATLIEIEPAVVSAARLFEKVNHAPWKDPRLTIVYDDGRNFLRRSEQLFDIIVSEPSNPWMTGAASLFTVEFFTTAAAKLAARGVFLQWLQIYELAPERITSLLKTYNAVFPHVLIFSAHVDSNDLLLIGSKERLSLDWQSVVLHAQKHAKEMERADLKKAEELLALLLGDQEAIAQAAAPLNTDDNALIEFGAPKDLVVWAEKDPEVPILNATAGARLGLVRRILKLSEADWPQVAGLLAEGYLRQGMLEDAKATARAVIEATRGSSDVSRLHEVYDTARLLGEDDKEAVVAQEGASDPDYAAAARLMTEGEDSAALRIFEKAPGLDEKSSAHALLYGYLQYRSGDHDEARRALGRANKDDAFRARYPAVAYYLAKDAYSEGEYALAAEHMKRYRRDKRQVLAANEAGSGAAVFRP